MAKGMRDVEERIEWLDGALGEVRKKPQLRARLEKELERGDVEAFSETLLGHWRELEIEPPGDKCDPYVTAYVTVFRPPEAEYVCTWIGPVSIAGGGTQNINVSGTPAKALQMLIALGLVRCEWVLKSQAQVLEIKKFVQGICPPGTF